MLQGNMSQLMEEYLNLFTGLQDKFIQKKIS